MNKLRSIFGSIRLELALTCLLLAAFRIWPVAWQLVDGQAASSDSGIVHLLVFGVLGAAFILTAVWVILSVAFPTLDKFIERGEFGCSFRDRLSGAQRIAVSLAVIGGLAALILACAYLAK